MRMNKLSFFSKAEVNVLNQIIKAGALVCALAMLEWNPAAVAEEKRLGDYIYSARHVRPGRHGRHQPAR